MVGGQGGDPPVAAELPAHPADGRLGGEEPLGGEPAEGDDDAGPDDLELLVEVGLAAGDLAGFGGPGFPAGGT